MTQYKTPTRGDNQRKRDTDIYNMRQIQARDKAIREMVVPENVGEMDGMTDAEKIDALRRRLNGVLSLLDEIIKLH